LPKEYSDDVEMVGMPKLDGASLALYYKNGEFYQAITRGDGITGRIVTANAVKFKGIPKKVNNKLDFSVRGEVLLTVENWNKLDPNHDYQNPRNFGTGILGRKDGSDSSALRFMAFDIVSGVAFKTKDQKLKILKMLGFTTVPYRVLKTVDDCISYYNYTMSKRKDSAIEYFDCHIWVDGTVFEANEIDYQDKLGYSSGRPKFAIAYKPDSPGNETTIKDIIYTVGHTGKITPVAELEPVEIAGTIVSRATLHNFDNIAELKVRIGCKVWVEKGGEIIPQVMEVLDTPSNAKEIKEPSHCPVCNGSTARKVNSTGKEGSELRCTNSDCTAQQRGKISRWVTSLDIKGIGTMKKGDTVLDALIAKGLVKTPADLYRLTVNDISTLNVGNGIFGDKRANKIVEEIEKSKELTIDEFLGSLGIDHLGKRRVEIIRVAANGELDTLEDWLDKNSKLVKNSAAWGIPNIAATIQDGLENYKNIIYDLISVGVTIKKIIKKQKVIGKLTGKTFVLTGSFSRIKNDIEADIEACGGEIASSVSKKLNYLVQSDSNSTSSKSKKANELGVKIISEKELEKMLQD
jgi:DNA ligase (NAD+)